MPAIAAQYDAPMRTANLAMSACNYSQAEVVPFIGVISDLYGWRATLLI